jgi:hypothetical protein
MDSRKSMRQVADAILLSEEFYDRNDSHPPSKN